MMLLVPVGRPKTQYLANGSPNSELMEFQKLKKNGGCIPLCVIWNIDLKSRENQNFEISYL